MNKVSEGPLERETVNVQVTKPGGGGPPTLSVDKPQVHIHFGLGEIRPEEVVWQFHGDIHQYRAVITSKPGVHPLEGFAPLPNSPFQHEIQGTVGQHTLHSGPPRNDINMPTTRWPRAKAWAYQIELYGEPANESMQQQGPEQPVAILDPWVIIEKP